MKRIIIEAEKCDGCKSCSLACMQAHRKDSGDIYTLDLNDINNESRNFIYKQPDGSYRPIFCRHCDEPECVISCMSGVLPRIRRMDMFIMTREMRFLLYVCNELSVRGSEAG